MFFPQPSIRHHQGVERDDRRRLNGLKRSRVAHTDSLAPAVSCVISLCCCLQSACLRTGAAARRHSKLGRSSILVTDRGPPQEGHVQLESLAPDGYAPSAPRFLLALGSRGISAQRQEPFAEAGGEWSASALQRIASSARLSVSTLTRRSPVRPSSRPSWWALIKFSIASTGRLRARAIRCA